MERNVCEMNISQIHMPQLICGRGSLSFVNTLHKKRAAVLGYADSVRTMAEALFAETDTEIRYIATVDREPLISDLFRYVEQVRDFAPDLILAIGGGSVMDMAKGLHLFYEHPELTFADCLKPFSLPELGVKAQSVFVPTTSGTGSETSSAAVFIDPETRVKSLLLSNTLIPTYAVIDAELTDPLPDAVLTASALDALCHAIESTTAQNASVFTKAVATEAALDILEYLPAAVDHSLPAERTAAAREKVHMAATLSGIAITNAFTGIVHSYDHPGPAFDLPHGLVCAVMLPWSMELVGPNESYACISRRLGYTGDTAQLSRRLMTHILEFDRRLGISTSFMDMGIDEAEYFANVPRWAEISLQGMATKMSPAQIDVKKGVRFYTMSYYGTRKSD